MIKILDTPIMMLIIKKEIMMKRTGVGEEDADFYIEMAETKVRTYLNLEPEADISKYSFQVADIATLYWQKDTSVHQSQVSLGYASESFQEGNVRHTTASMTGSAIFATYDAAVLDIAGDAISQMQQKLKDLKKYQLV